MGELMEFFCKKQRRNLKLRLGKTMRRIGHWKGESGANEDDDEDEDGDESEKVDGG